MKIDKVYLRRQYGSTHIVPGKTLAKVFEAIDGNLCIILVRIIRSSLDLNVLDMLENTTLCEPFVILIKIDQVFLIGQSLLDNKCQPVLSLIGIYQK